MITDNTILNRIDQDFYFYKLEKEWKARQSKITDVEWLKLTPKAKHLLPNKIAEWQKTEKELLKLISEKLLIIRRLKTDLIKILAREQLKQNEGTKLLRCKKQIKRLKRLSFKKQNSNNSVTQEDINKALNYPLETLVEQNTALRKVGHNFTCLCPLPNHEEKTPSFTIFTNTNRFWCFGCSTGGNSIDFVMLTKNKNFQETVKSLI
jgi:hypothetical protein